MSQLVNRDKCDWENRIPHSLYLIPDFTIDDWLAEVRHSEHVFLSVAFDNSHVIDDAGGVLLPEQFSIEDAIVQPIPDC